MGRIRKIFCWKQKRWFLVLLIPSAIFALSLYFVNPILISIENNEPSISIGTPKDGSLINGKRMPLSGVNFKTYSLLGSMLGRTSTHSKVRSVILESYARIYKLDTKACFTFGEMSWPSGGRLRPHVTHRNGLSVDFFVPIQLDSGKRTCPSTQIWNAWGYKLRFDSSGRSNGESIDFETIALHLKTLHEVATEQHLRIVFVIFETELQRKLLQTKHGNYIQRNIRLSKLPAWVRHDNHYHVDFEVR